MVFTPSTNMAPPPLPSEPNARVVPKVEFVIVASCPSTNIAPPESVALAFLKLVATVV